MSEMEKILASSKISPDSGSLGALRERAAAEAIEQGIPSRRSEAWRYAELGWIGERDWVQAAITKQPANSAPTPLLAGSDQIVLGDMASMVSSTEGIHLESLPALLAGPEAWPVGAERLGENGFGALNGARFSDGAFIRTKVEAEGIVELVNTPIQGPANSAILRHVVHLGARSHLTLIERAEPSNRTFWTDSMLFAKLAEGARLTHIRLLDMGDEGIGTSAIEVDLAAGSQYHLVTIAASGRVIRQDVRVRMAGEGAVFGMDVLSLAQDGSVRDIVARVDHLVPDCTSRQRVRSVLGAKSRANYLGTVYVAEGASGTDASQSAKAIMLARSAEANTKPELLIYADDVKCAHGATVGELDAEALFYLMSRGISPTDARAMLVEAFLTRLIDDLEPELLRQHVATMVSERVPAAGDDA